MVEKTIKVVGMHCPSCVSPVELALTDIDGVDEAKANIETGTVEIKLDDSVSDDDITEAVEDVGFKVE